MKAKYITIIMLLFLAIGIASAQTVYYVDGTVSSSGTGMSWAQAFKTVQEGINAAGASLSTPASDTAEVWVKEGTYYIYVDSDENTVSMAEGVMIYGGFNGTETKRDDRDWENNVTTLDGHRSSGSSQQVKHVVTAFGNEVSTDVYESWSNGLIDGFTITGGEISVGPGKANGIKATDPSSILSTANGSSGAGILIFKCGPNVSNCKITDNSALKGGGMYIVTATEFPVSGNEPKPEIYNCEISNNYATSRGGGISLDVGTEPTFINCKIQNNTCAAKGGGIYIDWVCPEPVFINCLFTGNYASRAGALGADGSSSPLLINCTVANNSAEDIGAGFYTGSYNPDGSGSNDPTLINCIVWGNRCEWGGPTDIRIWHENYFATSHSALGEGFTSYGDGVIYQDPELADTAGNDYSLTSGSPCINTGTASDALDADNLIPNYDINGDPRDGSPDMGCYEFTGVVCTSYSDTTNAEICEGDSLFAAGEWQLIAGTYYDSLLTVDNCDSIIVTILAVNEAYGLTEDVAICNGGSYTLPDGTEVTEEGTYTSNFTTTAGCDSIITTNLTIGTAYNTEVDASICNGESYTLPDGTEVSTEDTYTVTLTAVDGCDSIIVTHLTLNLTYNLNEEVKICYGSTYTLPDGTLADTVGTFISNLTSVYGCDSIITTEVSLDSGYHVLEVVHICKGESFTLPDGREVSERGVYFSEYTSVTGCDSILVTRLETPPAYDIEANITLCAGGSFTLPDGTEVTTAGTYVNNLTSVHGCDSTITFNVDEGPAFIVNNDVFLCEGESYTLPDGTVVSDTGLYENNYVASVGCDSIIRTHISHYPAYDQTVNVAVCEGEIYTLPDGNSADEEGSYISYLTTEDGCDSTITTNLTINATDIVYEDAAVCSGESYTLPDGTAVSTGGNYYSYLSSVSSCDSIVVTTLTINPEFEDSEDVTICEGEPYTLPDGTEVTDAGTYTSNLTSIYGCDSTIITNVLIGMAYNGTEDVDICEGESYTLPDGTEVTEAGAYTSDLISTNGCDSIIVTTVTINPTYNVSVDANICQGASYMLPDGTEVNAEGTYTSNLTTAAGCDSVIVINLTVNAPFNETEEVFICANETYTLPDGTEVSEAGEYTSTLETAAGCDSIITTILVVHPAFEGSEDISICSGETYTLPDGTEVTEEGTYTSTLETGAGCDSIIVTNLTITNTPPTPIITQDGNTLFSDKPEGNQWYLNNLVIEGANEDKYVCMENGDYHAVLIGQEGCNSEASNVITVILIGIESVNNLELQVYPNPAENQVYISGITGKAEEVTLSIFDVNGNQLYFKETKEDGSIDISSYEPGVYILKVSNAVSNKTIRIMKQ